MGLIHKNRCKSEEFFKSRCRNIDKLFHSLKGIQIICGIWVRFTKADVLWCRNNNKLFNSLKCNKLMTKGVELIKLLSSFNS